ncbi:hypothetical protein BDV95DRAFT_631060 [Massariosphaeria phaeospora]|uniref:Uncharacterized protein n=1 Tax=Massariosphaeria phaeospora TaxID=100035 RepID=A0A7C8M762_9PLEO|nr:hypothetical protein BDV95DRAFT_631060 [Massariosphaeria phaeospora]
MNGRTAVLTAIAATILGFLYLASTHYPNTFKMTPSSSSKPSGVPGLEFTLSQISKHPPSMLVTLKNHNPSSTFTLLKWGTPLDPQALNLGVFHLVDAEAGKEVPVDVIKIGRKMPPAPEELVTIMPGTEESTEVVFDKPWMPDTPAKYSVRAEGTFSGVWEKAASDVEDSELEAYADSKFFNRSFATEEAVLNVT